jgi:NADPH:quinone reductase-like Zn-dependent oxidoreductase
MALLPAGGYAERVSIDARLAVELPPELDFIHAAAIPEAFMTANEALFECAQLRPGELLLVPAAAGGVGSAAVQLGLCNGARVVGLASGPQRCAFVEGLGAHTLDRTSVDFPEQLAARYGERPVDVLLDFLGPRAWPVHAGLLADGARMVIVGLLAGGKTAEVDFGQLLVRAQSMRGLVMRPRSLDEKIATTRRFARNVLPLFRSGRLRVHVDSVFSLQEVAAAHRHMEANAHMGKIVLTMDAQGD